MHSERVLCSAGPLCPPVRNSRISLLFAPVSRPISLSRDHVELTATRRRHDDDARRKPVPAKNVNGISSPVNLFSSYCCARQKTGRPCIFSCVCSSRSRHQSACAMLPKNHARRIGIVYRMHVYRSSTEGILSSLHLLHICVYIYICRFSHRLTLLITYILRTKFIFNI